MLIQCEEVRVKCKPEPFYTSVRCLNEISELFKSRLLRHVDVYLQFMQVASSGEEAGRQTTLGQFKGNVRNMLDLEMSSTSFLSYSWSKTNNKSNKEGLSAVKHPCLCNVTYANSRETTAISSFYPPPS